jgi:hypothetical protein
VFRQETPYQLSPSWKLLLLSDGSVTRHLQLMTNERVEVGQALPPDQLPRSHQGTAGMGAVCAHCRCSWAAALSSGGLLQVAHWLPACCFPCCCCCSPPTPPTPAGTMAAACPIPIVPQVECLEMRDIGDQREGLPPQTAAIEGPLVQRQVCSTLCIAAARARARRHASCIGSAESWTIPWDAATTAGSGCAASAGSAARHRANACLHPIRRGCRGAMSMCTVHTTSTAAAAAAANCAGAAAHPGPPQPCLRVRLLLVECCHRGSIPQVSASR